MFILSNNSITVASKHSPQQIDDVEVDIHYCIYVVVAKIF